jgi:hypothetical protein
MADPDPHARRPQRPRASARRTGRLGRPVDTEETRVGTQTLAVVRAPLSWPKRIGILVALVAIGGTVILAGGALTSHAPTGSGSPRPGTSGSPAHSSQSIDGTAVPDVAPVIIPPDAAVTKVASWTAQVTIPQLSLPRQDLRLRIYRDGKQIRDVAVRKGSTMTVRNIPLKRGANSITAAFVGPGGVGPVSAAVAITLDQVAPSLRVTAPAEGAVINSPSAEVRGTTEPGVPVTVLNASNSAKSELTAAADGTFDTTIELGPGKNEISIAVADAVGNTTTNKRSVVHGTGKADVQLTISQDKFRLRRLPASFDADVLVYDADGAAVDGAAVTFSLSAPGQPTSRYDATTDHGTASWLGITLTRDSTEAGTGFVTVMVTLADRTVLRDNVPFEVK